MDKLKNILIGLIAATITFVGMYGGYTIYAAEDKIDYQEFLKESDAEDIIDSYHNSINTFFNDRAEYFVELVEEDPKFFDHKDFVAPAGADSKSYDKLCGENNVSSYCVSMQGLDIYLSFADHLTTVKSKLVNAITKEAAISGISKRNEIIDNALEDAKLVFEAAMGVYDEFKMSYSMHVKFTEVINSLLKYKIALTKISQETAAFPSRFIDATSSQCE